MVKCTYPGNNVLIQCISRPAVVDITVIYQLLVLGGFTTGQCIPVMML